ncbi:methyltransferase domain-containing protein [Aureimonas leprariae]|uniref:Methyltransferase domain-containing protein n=1 Tax=Plantimonas leprariae TaxID=2615207 RepID=A0A7V7PLB8_9HYPH|nr:methyltransferase domain-containing protein [Aureimonas leprariae]KAB0677063.1 methyltransferase domain-containing protein [Aureimonas leprariae]
MPRPPQPSGASHPAALFDRALLDRRRLRALGRAGGDDAPLFLLQAVARELAERLSLVERRFERAAEIGGHTGEAARLVMAGGQVGTMLRVERDAAFLGDAPDGIVGDEEALPLPEDSVDLVLSPLSLHLTNDTPGTVIQARRALKPDGLFLAAALGGETLHELRTSLLEAEAELLGGASPRVAPFIDVRDAGALLQRAGLALPVADQDRITVRYASMFDLCLDLRRMGMANMLAERRRSFTPRGLFLRAAEIYAERFAGADGRVRATFDVVYMSGWKPHPSQQQPLRPGSAKASLAEALRDRSGKDD